MNTDRDWSRWAADDPYYGVLSLDKFRAKNLSAVARKEFFESGAAHMQKIISTVFSSAISNIRLSSALDFGCGVGRLLIPLAQHADMAIGVDISQEMLDEAARNASNTGTSNIRLLLSDDGLTQIPSNISFIHSCLVFQHIPWHRGRWILRKLAEKVDADGHVAIQLLTATSASRLTQILTKARYAFPPIHWVRNVLKHRPALDPVMQLNVYDLETMLADLRDLGFASPTVLGEPSAMKDFTSVYVIAQRSATPRG